MEITIKGREFKPSKPNGYWRKVGIPSRGTGLYEALNKGLPYDVYSNLNKYQALLVSQMHH